MPNPQNQNLYIQNFIRARNYSFTPVSSEMIGRLCAVEGAITQRDTASEAPFQLCEELLAVFRGTPRMHGSLLYEGIDRVCLAARIGVSNELIVLNSCNGDRARANTMEPLYRCFVRPNSSLFQLREGELRIYDDASRIAAAFEDKKKPIQRSLAYVMKMGFKSGLTIPLHLSGELRGFLFMNSVEESLFSNFADEDYAILNFIAMVAKLALASEARPDTGYERYWREGNPNFDGKLFDEVELSSEIQAYVKWQEDFVWRPQVKTSGKMDFLYSPANLAYAIAKVCYATYPSPDSYPKEISVVNRDDGTVQVCVPASDLGQKMTSLKAYQSRISQLDAYLRSLRFTLSASINNVVIQLPYDPVGSLREDILYSVPQAAQI